MSHRLPACGRTVRSGLRPYLCAKWGLFSVAATQAGSLCYIDSPERGAMFHNTRRKLRRTHVNHSGRANSSIGFQPVSDRQG